MNTSQQPKQPEILDKLTELEKSGQLDEGVKKADHFTEEDEESATRKGRSNLGVTANNIKRAGMWVVFCFGIFLLVLLGWMLWRQVCDIVLDAQSRASALNWLWSTILTVGATLFVERHLISKKRK